MTSDGESALDRWHRELREGLRTTTTFDDLWRAACREAADREFEAFVAPQRAYLAALRERQSLPQRPRRRRMTKGQYALEVAEAE